MNARIIKETRSLLPVFGVMLLAAALPPLIWTRDTASGVGVFVFVGCAAVLAASSFGNEFQWRTLPLLLTQPVPRRKLWLEKMLVLAVALAAGFVVLLSCTYVPDSNNDGVGRLLLALVPLCALCGAPCFALAVKNTIGAAALTVTMPFAVWLLIAGLGQESIRLLDHFFPEASLVVRSFYTIHEYLFVVVPALVYCVALGWLGYATFMGLQAVESQLLDINLPAGVEMALARPLRRFVPGYTGPWASLFRKELQLHRVSFILAGLMLLLVPLQVIGWGLFHSEFMGATMGVNFVMCVFVIPLVAAGMSVAEERNLGVAGWQFVQPVSARKQWTAKILVVLFICVTLGVLLPVAGLAIREKWFGLDGPKPPNLSTPEDALSFFIGAPLFYLLIISVGVYASSLSRTTLQAIIRTLALIMLFAAGLALLTHTLEAVNWYYRVSPDFPLPKPVTAEQAEKNGQLTNEYIHILHLGMYFVMAAIGALMVFVVGLLQFLAYANFRKGDQASDRGWIKTGLTAALICGLAFAVIIPAMIIADNMTLHWINTHLSNTHF